MSTLKVCKYVATFLNRSVFPCSMIPPQQQQVLWLEQPAHPHCPQEPIPPLQQLLRPCHQLLVTVYPKLTPTPVIVVVRLDSKSFIAV